MKTFKQFLKEDKNLVNEAKQDGWNIRFDSIGEKNNYFARPDVDGDVIYFDEVGYKYIKDKKIDHWDNIHDIHDKIYQLAQKFDRDVISLLKKYGYEYKGR